MPVFGWSNGMVPAFAYHRSAGSKDRMQAIAKVSITVVLGITLCGTAVCSLLTPQLLHLFDASDTMLQVGIPALRIVSLSFPFAGFCVIANSIFQAFGKGFYSIVLTMIRQFVIWIPCAYCIGKWLQLDGIWWSFLIAEWITGIITARMLRRSFR